MEKVVIPAWTLTRAAPQGFWMVAIAQSAALIRQSRSSCVGTLECLVSIKAWPWFARLIVAGELVVGVC